MTQPNMPKVTAVWLIENTGLTFKQIATFCHLHELEVQALADEDGIRITGQSPISEKILTREEITRCEADPEADLVFQKSALPDPTARVKGPRYTPVSKRGDKPDAIAWVLKFHPELSDAQIVKLIGTTKNTINNIRERTHANISNIRPRSPVDLSLCKYDELDKAVEKARAKMVKEGKPLPVTQVDEPAADDNEVQDNRTGGFDFSNFLNTGTDNQ